MKIMSEQLLAAFRHAREKYRSNAEMARLFGISDSMLSRILKGRVSHISDKHWLAMRCFIEPSWCGRSCPDADGCELRKLLLEILKIDDPSAYSEITSMIQEKFSTKEIKQK